MGDMSKNNVRDNRSLASRGIDKKVLVLLMMAGVMVGYIVRVNISHAIIPISNEFSLSYFEQGIILSAFSWGYAGFMLVGGILVDKVGAAKMALIAALCWSGMTSLTAMGFVWMAVFCTELLTGASEAPLFPSNSKIVFQNFLVHERGFATAVYDSGSYVGIAVGGAMMGFFVSLYSWRVAILLTAALGVVWAFLWWRFVKIRGDLQSENSRAVSRGASGLGVAKLLRSRKVVGASIGFFCYNYIKNFYLTWFPSFLVMEKGFTVLGAGVFAVIPSVGAIVGEIAAGSLTDCLIKRGFSVTFARKLPLCCGLIFSGSIAFASLTESPYVALAIMTFSFAMAISASPSIWSIPGDIAPSEDCVGTIGGIQNTFSNLAGIIAPIVTGAIVSATGGFETALLVSALVAIVGALSYLFIVGKLEKIEFR